MKLQNSFWGYENPCRVQIDIVPKWEVSDCGQPEAMCSVQKRLPSAAPGVLPSGNTDLLIPPHLSIFQGNPDRNSDFYVKTDFFLKTDNFLTVGS